MLKLNTQQKQMLKNAAIVKMSHQARIRVSDSLKDAESTDQTPAAKPPQLTQQK